MIKRNVCNDIINADWLGANVAVCRRSESLIQLREAGWDDAALSRRFALTHNVDVYSDEELSFHSDWHL